MDEVKFHLGAGLSLDTNWKRQKPDRGRVRTAVMPLDRVAPHPQAPAEEETGGMIESERLYTLRESNGEIFLEKEGTVRAYTVLGQAGSGKTHFLRHLLYQIIAFENENKNLKFGGLILDPKVELVEYMPLLFEAIGRRDDLVILNATETVNLLDCFLEPIDLGRVLAAAAHTAGKVSKEPFWINELEAYMAAALQLFSWVRRKRATLADLAELFLVRTNTPSGERELCLSVLIKDFNLISDGLTAEERDYGQVLTGTLLNYFEHKERSTITSFINQVLGPFLQPNLKVFSSRNPSRKNIYDSVIEEGKVILVSFSQGALAVNATLCAIIKCIFQRAVLTRRERYNSGKLTNLERPILFLADEYSSVATYIREQPEMSDSEFFAKMRHVKVLGLVATQSVAMLKSSSIGDAWESLFTNAAAKIFFRCDDPATQDYVGELLGEVQFRDEMWHTTYGSDGMQTTRHLERDQRPRLPKQLVSQLSQGQAMLIGSTDAIEGGKCLFFRPPSQPGKLPETFSDNS